jgi:hypothetical protein
MKRNLIAITILLSLTIFVTACGTTSSQVASNAGYGEYVFINESSYTITLIDRSASVSLEPGKRYRAPFTNIVHSINKVQYEPTANVYPVLDGNTITFLDRVSP